MNDESSFFNSHDERVNGFQSDSGYHYFRKLYESEHGFCRVFTARRHGRIFIIKALRQQYLHEPLARTALRKEFDCGIVVDSPFVAHTYDFDTLPDLGPAIIAEYCPGTTLADIIAARQPLSAADIARIIECLAQGLDAIHSAGLIHRDLKPENVIWMPRSRSLKIIDFGFSDSESFYLLHNSAGTVRYTPPEKIEDDSGVDTYNDTYALGILLSDLLPVAPVKCRKALLQVSRKLTGNTLKSPLEAINEYKALTGRSFLRRKLVFFVPAGIALIAAALYLIIKPGAHQHENDLMPYDTIAVMHEDPKMVEEHTETIPPHEDQPTTSNAVPDYKSQRADNPNMISGIMVPPEELIKDEYGVCIAEAKYVALFSQNKLDKYVVLTTDSLIKTSYKTLQSDSATIQERKDAYELVTSEARIQSRAASLAQAKYADADLNRVSGLARHRWRYMTENVNFEYLKP